MGAGDGEGVSDGAAALGDDAIDVDVSGEGDADEAGGVDAVVEREACFAGDFDAGGHAAEDGGVGVETGAGVEELDDGGGEGIGEEEEGTEGFGGDGDGGVEGGHAGGEEVFIGEEVLPFFVAEMEGVDDAGGEGHGESGDGAGAFDFLIEADD